MKNDVFVVLFGIVLSLFLYVARQLTGYALILIATLIYAMYCAYNYKGEQNFVYAAIPPGIFALFLYSAYVDATFANIMMFLFFGSMVFFAINSETPATAPVSD